MESLINLYTNVYPKARPWLVLVFIIAINISFAIENPTLKYGATSSLAVVILFLIFDIYKQLLKRLDKIDECLSEPKPRPYKNYTEALSAIEPVIIERLAVNKELQLRVLAVAAQFTWKLLIEGIIEPYLNDLKEDRELSKLTIHIAICVIETLDDWKQEQLIVEEEKNLKGIARFKNTWREGIGNRISLEIFQYDTLPQWHGILIDDDVLFRGKCEWSKDFTELHVGQKEYIKFEKNDRFGGAEHIALFENWFRACQERSNFLRDTGRLERNP